MEYAKKGFAPLNEDVMEQVTGGYLQVSQWRNYVGQSILPPLLAQYGAADASDQQVIDRVHGVIQSTMIPGAEVCSAIYGLRAEYQSSLRANVHSSAVRQTLDDAINLACDYLDTHA